MCVDKIARKSKLTKKDVYEIAGKIKKGTPSISLIKAITKPFRLFQGKEVSCSLIVSNEGKSKVVVSLESEYPPENSPEL